MSESSVGPVGREPLPHAKIQQLMQRLGESQIVNLDTSVRDLTAQVGAVLRPDEIDKLSLHILCCDEYFLVTD
jgi:hypothetical protein